MFSTSFKKLARVAAIAVLATTALHSAPAHAATTLVIESWRTGDETVWDEIIAKFKETNPEIDVKFQPTNPPDYNAALNAKLSSGTAGDLITCRPFDAGLTLFKDGNLTDLSTMKGMENFTDFARSAWTSDDGKTYCVPMASVIHGFIYNADYFAANDLKEPATYEEFLALLDTIKTKGDVAPLAIGTKEGWTTTSMGFDNIGPNFWGGEEGRKGLIDGTRKYSDKGFVSAFAALEQWKPFLPTGNEAINYTDAQGLFTTGQAAIFPAGSWEIAGFTKDADFKLGAFKAPPPAANDGKCAISDQLDIAMGVNPKSANKEAATKFLEFVATQPFAEIYGGELPGFFPLGSFDLKLADPLANTFLSWRGQCESTLRSSYQKLNSSADYPTENNLWNVTSGLLQGKFTPQSAGDDIQAGLDKWFKPVAAK